MTATTMMAVGLQWSTSHRSRLFLLLCICCSAFAIGTSDGADLPPPSITACDFARLRFSHIDDLFSVDELCPGSEEGTIVYPSDQPAATGDDGLVVTDALDQMWDAVVGHGWEQARHRAAILVDSNVEVGDLAEDSIAGAVATGEIVERTHQIHTNNAYPFLACVSGSTSTSTYAKGESGNSRLQVLLPKLHVLSSKVVVVSNKERESCFVVTTTADEAIALANNLDGDDENNDDAVIKVIPLVDAMKLEPSLPTEVCYNPEWMIPSRADDEETAEATWERSIHVTLRADLADSYASTSRSTLQTAQEILEDIKSWGLVGNRRRRQRRLEEDRGSLRKSNQNDYIPDHERALSDIFSLTSTVVSALGPKGDIAEFWSRELEEGLEADHLCASMFEQLGIQARFGNAGFTIVLNPHAEQQKSPSEGGADQGPMPSDDSARNPSCLCSLLSALAAHPHVVDVSTNRPIELHGTNGNVQGLVQSGNGAQKPFNAAGITGQGEVVGVVDSGVNVNHCFFRDVSNTGGSIYGTSWNMGATKVLHYDDVWYDRTDNSGHGTHVAGTIAGKPFQGTSPVGNGVAEDAKLAVFDFAISASGSFDPGVDRLFTSLYNHGKGGAKVINGSWGRQGSGVYSAECRDMDDALAQYEDILYVASAGNMGSWRTINSPADCKSTLAVGATFNQNGAGRDRLVSYSSRGPTADGRIKPDVVAPGFSIQSSTGGACGWRSMDGTSMSAPGVSGAAALVRQYLREGFLDGGYRRSGEGFDPSGSLVKAILMNSGRSISHVFTRQGKVAGTSRAYDNSQGHGAVHLTNTLPLQGINDLSAFAVDNAVISDAQTFTFEVDTTKCNSNTAPLGGRSSNKIVSVTLAYYDPPAQAGSKESLVNDLDLWVEGPNGEVLHSNGLTQNDRKNTVERVRWSVTTDGIWRIKINAANLATANQKFSVFGSGCFSTDPHPTPRRSDTTIYGHLDSLFIGGVRNSGAYFDLVAKEGLEVQTFYIHTPLKTVFDVWVYSTDGTWQGKERSPWEWSGVQIKGVQGRGAGIATPIKIPRLMIRGGQTKGIYIDMVSHRDLRYSAVEETVGSVYSENRDLQILVGAGADPNFSTAYPQRMANIRVKYKRHSPYDRLQDGASSSLSPTIAPIQTHAFLGYHSLSTQEVLGQLSFSTSIGSMFNIRAKDKRITLKSLNLNLESPSTQLTTFHIYERDGGHISYEQSPDEWNITGVVRVKTSTTGSATSIPLDIFDSPITIEAGELIGLYISTPGGSSPLLRSALIRDKMVGEVAVENDDMEIQVGTSNDSGADHPDGFGDFRLQRVIDVEVDYET